MAGELAHARLDHRRLRRLRPRLDGPMVVEPARRASDRGPAGPADVLPARAAVRTPRDPSTNRYPGRRAGGARGLEANRPRGRRAETGPGDRAAALPRSPRPRAHPRLERRVCRSSAVQRGSALQPAIRDRAQHLPDGAHALRERRVAGGGGAFRPRLSLAGVAEIPPRPPRRQPGGHPADTGPAPRGPRRRHRNRRRRGVHPEGNRRGRAVEGPGRPHDGRRRRVPDAVPRREGVRPRRESATGPGPRQVRGSEGKVVLHVREDRLQTGPVHPARPTAPGSRSLRVPRERFRGPCRTVAPLDVDAAGTSAAHAGHGVLGDAGESGVPRRLSRGVEEESTRGFQGRGESLARRPRRLHVRTGSRGARGPLRTPLLLSVSEHHGEVQHLRGDARLFLLPHGWHDRSRVAIPSVHATSRYRRSRAEAANRATAVLQEDEEGTGSAPRCLHWAGHDSQVDLGDYLTATTDLPQDSRSVHDAKRADKSLARSELTFLRVQEVDEVAPQTDFVYCFEMEENLNGFVTQGNLFVSNSFGYQGYKNARFGRIECHEAINAYARNILVRTMEIAESHGYEVVHGIVDSVWLRPTANADPIDMVREHIAGSIGLPIELEGRYKRIVFLPCKTTGVGALNRYYGLFQDDEFKLRGIELRKHDTPEFINICQEAMLGELSLASTAAEFLERIPKAVDILRWTAKCVLDRAIPVHQFILTKSVSRTLTEYVVLTATAAALKQLEKRGFPVEPGESVRYVLMDARARDSERKVRVAEFLQGDEAPDAWEYIKLLARSGQTLLAPFGYTEDKLFAMCKDLSDLSLESMPYRAIAIQEDHKYAGVRRSKARGGVGYKKPWRVIDDASADEFPADF